MIILIVKREINIFAFSRCVGLAHRRIIISRFRFRFWRRAHCYAYICIPHHRTVHVSHMNEKNFHTIYFIFQSQLKIKLCLFVECYHNFNNLMIFGSSNRMKQAKVNIGELAAAQFS